MRIGALIFCLLLSTFEARGVVRAEFPIGVLQADRSVQTAKLVLERKSNRLAAGLGCSTILSFGALYAYLGSLVFATPRSGDRIGPCYVLGWVAFVVGAFMTMIFVEDTDFLQWSIELEGESQAVFQPKRKNAGDDTTANQRFADPPDPVKDALNLLDSLGVTLYDSASAHIVMDGPYRGNLLETAVFVDANGQLTTGFSPRLVLDPEFFEGGKKNRVLEFLFVQVFHRKETPGAGEFTLISLDDYKSNNHFGSPSDELIYSQFTHRIFSDLSFVRILPEASFDYRARSNVQDSNRSLAVLSSSLRGFLGGAHPLELYEILLNESPESSDSNAFQLWDGDPYQDKLAAFRAKPVGSIRQDEFLSWHERWEYLSQRLERR